MRPLQNQVYSRLIVTNITLFSKPLGLGFLGLFRYNKATEAMNEQTTKWKREISAGGVVYKKDLSQIFILLINPKSRNFGPPEDYWTFPKGKQEPGEDFKQAAVREVREEAGVNADIEQELGYVKYFRNWEGDKAIKFVHFFLMKYVDGNPADHDEETATAAWVKIDEVESRLKFDTDKETFEKAKKFLNT
jgi:8-oxo-dGTP pyrophosphatase MutT (NUDIX family)